MGQKKGQKYRSKSRQKKIGAKNRTKRQRRDKTSGEEQSLIPYKASQDKLNENSRIGKVSKIR